MHHEIITEIVEIMAMKVLQEKNLGPIKKGDDTLKKQNLDRRVFSKRHILHHYALLSAWCFAQTWGIQIS